MGLTIIAGRAGSGKSLRVARRIGDLARDGKPSLLLVPEQYTLEAERALMAALSVPGLLHIQVMSPSRFMEDVFSRVGSARRAVIDERGKAMALRRAAESCLPRLRVFGRVARSPGFAAGMAGLLSDLKRFDVTAGQLREAVGGDDLLRMKLEDTATLYQAFDDFLAGRSFMDEEDRMAALIDALPRAHDLRDTAFFVDEFDYLPPRTVRMLDALLRLSGQMTVTLTLCGDGDPDAAVFEAGRGSLRALTRMAGEAGWPVEVERLDRLPGRVTGRDPQIDHLERALYAYPAPPCRAEGGAVRLYEAAAPEDEVESAAGRVAALVRGEGLRWRDIAVVCGDLPEYAPRVQRIFGRHGIPVFLDNRRPVLHHPAVACLLSSLRVLAGDYRAHDILTLVKSGYAGVPDEGAEMMERYIAQFGIRGRGPMERPWTRGAEEYDLPALNGWREAVAAPLRALREGTGRRAAAADWARSLYRLLEQMGTAGRIREEAEALRQRGLPGPAAESTQVWNAMMDMLDQADGLLGDIVLTAAEMADIMETGFSAAEVGVLPTGGDLVLVGDVGRTKTAAVEHLFVLGAVEGCLPARYPEGAVFHDRDMARLIDAGVTVGRSAAVRAAQSRQGAYAAFSKPLRGLWLYWPATDGAGGARQPSPLVSRVSRLLGVEPEKAPPPGVTTPSAAMRPLAAGLRELAAGRDPGTQWRRLAAALGKMPAWRPRLLAMAAPAGPGGTPPRLEGLLPAGASVSVSQLEQYARCSFAWFVTYALAPLAWKSYRVALSDAGVFVHAAAAAFGARLLSVPDPAALSDERAESLMDGVVDGLIADAAGALTDDGHGRWMAGRMRAACRQAARRFLGQMRQGAFRPRYYEAGFGPGGRFPLIPAGSDTGVSLRGFVDRVDAYSAGDCDYLRVIDYKTGGAKLDPAGAMDGYQVQLWVYLRALCAGWRQVTGRPARPAGLFYFPVRDEYTDDRGGDPELLRAQAARMNGLCLDDPAVLAAMDRDLALPDARSSIVGVRTGGDGAPRGAVCTAAQMEAVGRGVMDTVAGMVRSIRAGRVEAVPLRIGQRTACAGCPYRPVCGVFGTVGCRKPSSREAVAAWTAKYLEEVHRDA